MKAGVVYLQKWNNFMQNKSLSTNQVIYVTEPSEVDGASIEMLRTAGYQVAESMDELEMDQVIALFIRTYTQATESYLSQFKNLRYVLRAGVGLDNIDLDVCQKRNIQVFNSPGANKEAVAEYIVAMAILMIRKIPHQIGRVKSGGWRDVSCVGTGIKGKTIGLVGCGNVGRDVVDKMSHLKVKFVGYDPYVTGEALSAIGVTKVELNELLKIADVVVIMLPLTKETNKLINKTNILLMKQDAIFINVSRGEIVDHKVIISALKKGAIGGVVLDVIEGEPNVDSRYLEISNVIITPHIAGFTKEANAQISIDAVSNFLKAVQQ